jgi:DNA-directed RNA polymerase subunit RPC12/RpoP
MKFKCSNCGKEMTTSPELSNRPHLVTTVCRGYWVKVKEMHLKKSDRYV